MFLDSERANRQQKFRTEEKQAKYTGMMVTAEGEVQERRKGRHCFRFNRSHKE